nr:NUDIX hydrolase [Peribacillus alkalitolerans]
MSEKRKNVWLAVAGLVITDDGKWLVVKKKYSGLKGMWSLPAGFVNANETVDEAVKREVFEETGIEAENIGLVGMRSGVIRGEISDNMLIFLMKPLHKNIMVQERELFDVAFLTPEELMKSENHSIMLDHLINFKSEKAMETLDGINPGNHFGYTAYKLFL